MATNLPSIGDTVTICGDEKGVVICISDEKVLVLRCCCNPQFVTGHYPRMYEGGLVWGHGHYFMSGYGLTYEKALQQAVNDYCAM